MDVVRFERSKPRGMRMPCQSDPGFTSLNPGYASERTDKDKRSQQCVS